MRHRKDPRSHETRQTPALAPDNSRVHFNYYSITAGAVQMMSLTFPHAFPSEPKPDGPKQTSFEFALQSTLHFLFKKKITTKKKSNIWYESPLECIFLPLFMDEKQSHIYGEGGAAS